MSPSIRFRVWFRRTIFGLLAVLCVLFLVVAIRVAYTYRDRNPGYSLSIRVNGRTAAEKPLPVRVGFGRRKINPDLSDPNRSVWMAGFSSNRAATAQHDDLWAVACVIDNGYTRLGIVALDAIGLFHDDVVAVRRQLPDDWRLDYTIVCSTHNHSTPDLMGLWGPSIFRTGVDKRYLWRVREAIVRSFGEAVAALQPARLTLHEIPTPPDGLVADTRKPVVFDPDIRLMVFRQPDNGATIGSLVAWANHPETPWSRNTEITADFPGILREALEKGIIYEGRVHMPGLGGIHAYVNGAIGGLMTTNPETMVHDPFLNQGFSKPSHEKSRALGNRLAQRILDHLASANVTPSETAPISIHARTVEVPITNFDFLLAPVLGLLDRGQVRWKTLRTEVALVTIGEAAIACLPGEIYPELVNGGVVRAPGGDFDIEPVEVPAIRTLMPGKVKFVIGMANDEIGYIIPKSEWDDKPPWLFGSPRRVYGEINSVGSETAPILYGAMRELIKQHGADTTARGDRLRCP